MSKKYKIVVQRAYDEEIEVEAEDEENAIKQADEMFDDLRISGFEMYNCGYEIEEVEDE